MQRNREAYANSAGSLSDEIPQVAITGLGLATPLGANASETWQALLRGEFITDHARVPQAWHRSRPRVLELALHAAAEALAQAQWSPSILADDATALVVGTSKGPIEAWLTPLPYIVPRECEMAGGVHPEGLGEIAGQLAMELRLGHGPRLTVSAACATGLQALIRGVLMIRSREAHRVLVVATESSLHPLFLASFQRLGVLATPDIGCRPFDQTRNGFLMSEAAAAVCLEARPGGRGSRRAEFPPAVALQCHCMLQCHCTTAPYSQAQNAPAGHFNPGLNPPSTVFVERFALGGDATHLTGGDPQAATLRNLLRHTLNGQSVDLIHAHGTGTETNDARELSALKSILPPSRSKPILYSHKGALGHSLGAAGLVSVVINCLSHQHGMVPGNVQTQCPLAMEKVQLKPHPIHRRLRRSLAMAAGFGGTVAIVSLFSS